MIGHSRPYGSGSDECVRTMDGAVRRRLGWPADSVCNEGYDGDRHLAVWSAARIRPLRTRAGCTLVTRAIQRRRLSAGSRRRARTVIGSAVSGLRAVIGARDGAAAGILHSRTGCARSRCRAGPSWAATDHGRRRRGICSTAGCPARLRLTGASRPRPRKLPTERRVTTRSSPSGRPSRPSMARCGRPTEP